MHDKSAQHSGRRSRFSSFWTPLRGVLDITQCTGSRFIQNIVSIKGDCKQITDLSIIFIFYKPIKIMFMLCHVVNLIFILWIWTLLARAQAGFEPGPCTRKTLVQRLIQLRYDGFAKFGQKNSALCTSIYMHDHIHNLNSYLYYPFNLILYLYYTISPLLY